MESQIFQESWPKRKETERGVAIEERRVNKSASKQTPNGILSNKYIHYQTKWDILFLPLVSKCFY